MPRARWDMPLFVSRYGGQLTGGRGAVLCVVNCSQKDQVHFKICRRCCVLLTQCDKCSCSYWTGDSSCTTVAVRQDWWLLMMMSDVLLHRTLQTVLSKGAACTHGGVRIEGWIIDCSVVASPQCCTLHCQHGQHVHASQTLAEADAHMPAKHAP
jgi:hypothetical protein